MATWTTYSSSYYVGGSTSASIYWSLPSLFTNHLFMRVSDVNNPTTRLDVTDYPIVVRGDSSIVLNTPNGGETWQGGTYQNITWAGNATVSGRYQVEYSINNGITWTLLTSSTYNTSYYWLLPNTPTSSARVRVTDYYNTCKNAVSNQSFTITAATPTLTVSYPNGGEGLYPGTSVSISWSSSYLPTSNLKLEYSTNGGSSWTTISSSISSSTFNYSWTVPDIPTSQALVRISLTSFPQIADTSNNTFTIYPYFTVTTPNGGQSWQGCSYQYLYFNKSSALGYVKLDYSLDNGSTWNVISANTYVGYGTSASYYWQVPNQASSNALIRVSDPNVPSRFDVTDVPFSIVPDYAIALNAPLGGEQWRAGTYQSISWAGNISVSGRYTLEYSINGGVSWNTITSGIYGTTYNWLIPNTPSTQVVIRVSDYNNTCKQTINNIFFTILPGIPTYIVTTPNGGEVVYSGASSYIYWSSQYVTGSFTKIEYSLDSGRVWTTIVNATNNSGSYLWSSIPAVYTNQALIRISDYNNPSVTDVSNSVFTIRKPITVTAPDGMEFVGGCTYTTISFNRGGASNYIKMEYSLNNGVSWNIITSSQYFATLEVNYNWLVPNLDGRNSCLVRVSDANNTAKFDVSDSTFTIFPAIRLIEPAYGGVFVGGTTRNITWWDTLTSDYYNIEYSLNNGSTWTIIAANTFIGNNTYAWTVPNIASTSALIRITDFQNTCKQSLTSISFSIAQVPNALTLNNPIGGNTYLACQVVPISWTASGTVGNVILEYSANAGTSWVALATNQPNVGSYNWTVPNLNSNNYLIRVRDITNSQIYDICNGTISLVATQANAGSAKLICSGDSVRLDGTGNGSFAWTGNGLSQTNSASPWAKPLQTTTYQLTVTNVYGCTASSSTTVTVQVKPVLQVTGATLCLGTSSSISATGANSYSWSPVSGLSNASSSSPIANPSSTTTYQVIGTTNGCSDTESVVVTVNPIPATPVISNIGNLTFCSGDSVLLNSSSSVGNQWFLAGNAINVANQTGYYAKTTGAYSVRTTVNGCSASSASINVSVQPRPLTPIITNSRSLNFCSGDSVILTSSALAGNVWSTGANSRSIVVKSSGTYTVLIQGAGCSSGIASATVQVTQSPSAPTLTASGATTFCSGDSLRITSSTGTGMNWSTGATNVSSIVVRASGTISGYVVANGCSSAVSNAFAVTVNPTPSAPTISANRPTTFCQGDSVVISSTGTENKLWSNGSTGNSLVVTSSGIYSVRAYALGCTSTVSNPISVLVNSIPATPTLTASTATTFCSGDSLRITSSTGTGMNWSTGATNVSSIVVRASGTISGYVVANGCSSSVSNAIAVTVNPTPSAPTISTSRPTTFCQGDSVVISSTGIENKLWSNGASGNTLVVKSSGVYSVRATALGCTSTVSNPISVLVNSIPATPTLTASGNTTFCSGDSLLITSSTGTGMNWSTGATNVSSIVVRASGTISGYVVANGCSSAVSNAVAVTVNPTPSAPTITSSRNPQFCLGDSVQLSFNGNGSPLWSNGSTQTSVWIYQSQVLTVQSILGSCTSSVSLPT